MAERLNRSFSYSIEQLRRIQMDIARRVLKEDHLPPKIRLIAGSDVAHWRDHSVGVTVVVEFPDLKIVECSNSIMKCEFPYIPTLLSFREAPVLLESISKLKEKPDVFMIDGQGIAHPLGCGLASHVGVLADIATIGVAKSLLCGEIGPFKGRWAPLIYEGNLVGAAVKTLDKGKPIIVSIGNKVSLKRSIEIVIECSRGHKMPEPIRMAHLIATKLRNSIREVHSIL